LPIWRSASYHLTLSTCSRLELTSTISRMMLEVHKANREQVLKLGDPE
jgi:hypothetical protein